MTPNKTFTVVVHEASIKTDIRPVSSQSLAEALRHAVGFRGACCQETGAITVLCPDGAVWALGNEGMGLRWEEWCLCGLAQDFLFPVSSITDGATDADILSAIELQTRPPAAHPGACGVLL